MAEATETSETIDILKDLLITQLLLSGVRQHDVRRIARVALSRVVRINKVLPRKLRDA